MTANIDHGRTDSATRFIAASADVIYRAFIDPTAWPQWLPPDGMTGHIYEFDARPGGTYRMALTYRRDHASAGKTSDDTDVVEGRFAELIPNHRVVQIVTFQSDDPAFAGEMRMTWSLSPAPGGTNVSIVAENVPAGISEADHDIGLRSTLENLAQFVE
ncbi:SRPBCC family protein [Bradyrhizobium sp. Leo121]|uniref:SRPBCC family protein n=1 Tax=Bradyrhizobium sp. Leo121 TaxID=1571195 RepID=UPI00102A60B9|nr:SRPBCC family protein [Bradyrhizobium sp. Leo121]RZN34354.1 ATPase [Bradyrhizobium sp. Leo121]